MNQKNIYFKSQKIISEGTYDVKTDIVTVMLTVVGCVFYRCGIMLLGIIKASLVQWRRLVNLISQAHSFFTTTFCATFCIITNKYSFLTDWNQNPEKAAVYNLFISEKVGRHECHPYGTYMNLNMTRLFKKRTRYSWS